MIDPLTLFIVGAGALAFREINKKDYGILTAERDERYRIAMSNCYDPQVLLAEAKLFGDYGLKAQAVMLKRRSEWRSRPEELKRTHEDVFQKAMRSTNIPAILEVAAAFEQWTATKKAAALREHARVVQEKMLQDAIKPPEVQSDENTTEDSSVEAKPPTTPNIPQNIPSSSTVIPQNTPPNGASIPQNTSSKGNVVSKSE